ncbi:alpha/beta hydrolase [Ferruginibacter sp.]
MKYLFLFLTITFTCFHAKAQQPAVTIPGSEVRKITSAIVTGQEYELHILSPGGNPATNKKYPVVYVMDSQWDFPLVKSIYGQQYFDGFIPEIIIVGVTWGGAKPNPDSLRARDYTPTNESRIIQSGGADKFLDFMKTELFPFIENNYKADTANRTLIGCSLGGLITLYAMLTHTDMFTGYAAASPAVGWDNEVLYKYEKKFAMQQINKPIRLYLTVGDVERSRSSFERFSNYISNKKYANVTIRSKVLENTGHSGTKSETYNRGLQFIFEKPDIIIADEILINYTGKYEDAKGNIVELKAENNKLVLYYSAANSYPLKAATVNTFYSNAEFLNMEFSIDRKTLQLNRYGSSQNFIKK